MGIPFDLYKSNPELSEWSIMLAYRGSIAHGMYLPSSDPNSVDDKDVMAVCVPPIDYYYGLKTYGSNGTREIKHDEWDIVVYEARKFISLLKNGNPNVLMMLWLEKKHYLSVSDAGMLIVDNRELFVGKHVYRSFTGYAYGQLHRMEHGEKQGHMGLKRKALMEKYGYDCKNAAHLIRLLKMGIEFLTDGVLYVERSDAAQLMEIKTGMWSLERVKTEAIRLFASAEDAYIHSKLRTEPNSAAIDDLCVQVVSMAQVQRHRLLMSRVR